MLMKGEYAFQANKSTSEKVRREFISLLSNLARKKRNLTLRLDWEEVKDFVIKMYIVNGTKARL